MLTTTATAAITADDATLDTLPRFLDLELHVSEPDVVTELCEHPDGRARHEYATGALRIGVLALRQAAGRIDATSIRHEGELIVEGVREALEAHKDAVVAQVGGRLAEYLDPETGRFPERVDRLIRKGGDLEQLINRQVGLDDSTLARTLAGSLGPQSPLMKHLSPSNAEGLLHSITSAVRGVSEQQRDRLLREFTLDNPDGALARVVGELKGRQGKLENGLTDLVKALAAELSLDKDGSAVSRLRRDVLEVLDGQAKRSVDFEKEMRGMLESMAARKEECARSTRHGEEFEVAVCQAIEAECTGSGDLVERLGTMAGELGRCKVGDCVVELGPDSVAAGARIVVEAKENASTTLSLALVEIKRARANRSAGTGLFVFSKKSAPAGLASIARYGDDVVVLWDADAASDPSLKAGLIIARAISVQCRKALDRDGADFRAIDQAIAAIAEQAKQLDEIQRLSTTVRNNGEKILAHATGMKKQLLGQVATLSEKVEALRALATGELAS